MAEFLAGWWPWQDPNLAAGCAKRFEVMTVWQEASAAPTSATDRFEWFSEMVSSVLMPLAFSTERLDDFSATAAALDLGAVQVSRFAYSSLRTRRTPALIGRGDPEQYHLALITEGSMWFSQRDVEVGMSRGDMALWDTSCPGTSGVGGDGPVHAIVLQVPKARLPLRADRVDRLLARRVSGRSSLGGVVADFLSSLAVHGPGCQPQDLARLGTTAVDLVSACIAQQLGTPEQAPAEARARALRARIGSFIEDNLDDAELTPHAIAAHHGVSLRTLYGLFQDEPESVAAFVRRRRLERCRADLAHPKLRAHPIAVIAARHGFIDSSVFSRAFREAYGVTPTDYRRQALDTAAARKLEKDCTPRTRSQPVRS
jgi:AraC-like DNA-binding protein